MEFYPIALLYRSCQWLNTVRQEQFCLAGVGFWRSPPIISQVLNKPLSELLSYVDPLLWLMLDNLERHCSSYIVHNEEHTQFAFEKGLVSELQKLPTSETSELKLCNAN